MILFRLALLSTLCLANQNLFAFLTHDFVTWVEKKLQFLFRPSDKIGRPAGILVLVRLTETRRLRTSVPSFIDDVNNF